MQRPAVPITGSRMYPKGTDVSLFILWENPFLHLQRRTVLYVLVSLRAGTRFRLAPVIRCRSKQTLFLQTQD